MRMPDSRKLPRPAREFSGELPKSAYTPAESGTLGYDKDYQHKLPGQPTFSRQKRHQDNTAADIHEAPNYTNWLR